MFSDKSKDKQTIESSSLQNIIAQGTKIVGDFNSEGNLRVDGVIEGHVETTGKVVVGKTGVLKGSLNATDAYFEGSFSGKLVLSGTLTLKSSAHVEGEVLAGKLAVEPGANFNVTCAIKGSTKDGSIDGKSSQRQRKGAKTA